MLFADAKVVTTSCGTVVRLGVVVTEGLGQSTALPWDYAAQDNNKERNV